MIKRTDRLSAPLVRVQGVLAVLAVLWVLVPACSKDPEDNNDADSATDTGFPTCDRDPSLVGAWHAVDYYTGGMDCTNDDWITLEEGGAATWERGSTEGEDWINTGYWCSDEGALTIFIDSFDGDETSGTSTEEGTYEVDDERMFWRYFPERVSGSGLNGEWTARREVAWEGNDGLTGGLEEIWTLTLSGEEFILVHEVSSSDDEGEPTATIIDEGTFVAENDNAILTVTAHNGVPLDLEDQSTWFVCAAAGNEVVAIVYQIEGCTETNVDRVFQRI